MLRSRYSPGLARRSSSEPVKAAGGFGAPKPGIGTRSQQTWDPAFHPPLIIAVSRPKLFLQVRFVFEHTAVKPERASGEQEQRKPRGERQRQAEHENQVPEIHRVAHVTIRPVLYDPMRRHAKSWTAAA